MCVRGALNERTRMHNDYINIAYSNPPMSNKQYLINLTAVTKKGRSINSSNQHLILILFVCLLSFALLLITLVTVTK